MNARNFNLKEIALFVAITSSLIGCDDTSDKIVDNIDTTRQADISFVNAVGEMADFYVKPNYLNRDVFDSQQKAKTVFNSEVGNFTFKWIDSGSQGSQFGVRDTNTSTTSSTIDTDIDSNAKYWMVAWLDGNQYQLTSFKKSSTRAANRFVVRVFSNTNLDIKINETDEIVAATEKGKVSVPFTIDNCAAGLNVGGNYIEFCNQAEFGKSYLAVVNSAGKIVVIEEQ